MSKVRVNFFLPDKYYKTIQSIAESEATSSAEIFREAIKRYINHHREKEIANILMKEKAKLSNASDCTNKQVKGDL